MNLKKNTKKYILKVFNFLIENNYEFKYYHFNSEEDFHFIKNDLTILIGYDSTTLFGSKESLGCGLMIEGLRQNIKNIKGINVPNGIENMIIIDQVNIYANIIKDNLSLIEKVKPDYSWRY